MSSLTFSPLSGAQNEDPLSYVLEIDDYRILIDCGWDERFIESSLDALKRIAPDIDAVLLSHSSINHLGALPLLIGRGLLRDDIQILATEAVCAMGILTCYDAHASRSMEGSFDLFSLDDVDAAFERIIQLKYSQSHLLSGVAGEDITVTPHVAGHTVGGTLWRIAKDAEEILYAVDFNHRRERHLNPCLLDQQEQFKRASLLITDSLNAVTAQSSRKGRDVELVRVIMKTLRRHGNVLLPTDTAGRVLEIAKVLDDHWAKNKLGTYGLVLLSSVSFNTVEFAKSRLEWMSDSMIRAFESARENPFQFKYMRVCHSLDDLEHFPKPMCVLASMSSLECGFARELFMQWCPIPQSTVLFTDRSFPDSVARRVMTSKPPAKIPIFVRWKVELTGAELEAHRAAQRAARATLEDREEENEDEDEEMEDAEQIDIDDGHQVRKKRRRRRRAYQPTHMQYPLIENEEHADWDEFGEIIKPDDFVALPDVVAGMVAAVVKQPEKKEERNQEDDHIDDTVPTKEMSEERVIDVNCDVKYIDLEGRSDGRSLRNILLNVAPRKLILVHGSSGATQNLVNFCNDNKKAIERVNAPAAGEIVDVTSDTSMYHLRLKDAFFDSVRMVSVGDCEVAHISAVLKPEMEAAVPDGEDEATRAVPLVAQAYISRSDPRASRVPHDELAPGRSCILVGDVKLSDLRVAINDAGLSTQFVRGALVINKTITLRKKENSIQVEGKLSEDYYRVRGLLYNQLHIF